MCREPLPPPPSQCNDDDDLDQSHTQQDIDTPFIHKSLESIPAVKHHTSPPVPRAAASSTAAAITEVKSIIRLALPMVLTGLLFYSRSMVSMLFLGRLGPLPLAGGALAIGFANITGYSVLSGLAMGMEPICAQAFGAKKPILLGLALHRTVLLLAAVSLPIALLWANMRRILLLCGQQIQIADAAQSYILFSLPDLLLQSLIHPLRIYLRSQSINMPLTLCAAAAIALHLPINYLLVSVLDFGIPGVALAGVWTNFNLVLLLISYVYFTRVLEATGGLHLSRDCLQDWKPLLGLAVPSCASVCLEWWWYEIVIMLCGLLADPRSTVASMGILIQTTSLVYVFPSSLSFGVSTRVGNELGANRPELARRAAHVGLSFSFLVGMAALAFAMGVRKVWSGMFTEDVEIARLTAAVLPILGLCELGNCPQTTGCGVLRGSARPRIGVNINLGAFYGVGMPAAVGLAFWGGLDFKGLWFGLLAAQAACVVVMLGVVRRTDWEAEAERAQKLTGGWGAEEVDEEKAVRVGALDGEDEKDGLVIKIEKSTALR